MTIAWSKREKAVRGWWKTLCGLPIGGGRYIRQANLTFHIVCLADTTSRRYDPPIPGWMLPLVWNTEEGLPHKGVLTCTHASKAAGLRFNWILRTALAQVIISPLRRSMKVLLWGREVGHNAIIPWDNVHSTHHLGTAGRFEAQKEMYVRRTWT